MVSTSTAIAPFFYKQVRKKSCIDETLMAKGFNRLCGKNPVRVYFLGLTCFTMGVSKNICSHVKRRCSNNLRSIDQKSLHIINLLVMPVSFNVYYLNHLCNAIKPSPFAFKS